MVRSQQTLQSWINNVTSSLSGSLPPHLFQLTEALNLDALKEGHETVLQLCSQDDIASVREGLVRLAQMLHTSTDHEDNRV